MLELAFRHKEKLQAAYEKTIHSERTRWYHNNPTQGYVIEPADHDKDNLVYVSIDKGNVVGYLDAAIYRLGNWVTNVVFLRLTDDVSLEFSRDMVRFFAMLFETYKFRKVVFTTTCGNPSEPMYNRLVKKMGGRIVGTFTEEVVIWNGEYRDEKHYEIMLSNWTENRHKYKSILP